MLALSVVRLLMEWVDGMGAIGTKVKCEPRAAISGTVRDRRGAEWAAVAVAST
jgi:hypothetical protein